MVDKENSRYLSSVGKACYQKKRKKKRKKDQCMSVITIIQVRIEKYKKKNVCINKEETFLASISQFGVRRRSLV